MEKELICIVCPNGCHLKIDDNLNVTGNICHRGEAYALSEIKNPERTVTSTIRLEGSKVLNVLPVKTSGFIPKSKIFEVMREINKLKATCPVKVGQVIEEDVLGLGVNIVATRSVEE